MIHIQRFIERLQGFDANGSQNFMMTMKDAKNLHADITKLLLVLQSNSKNASSEMIELKVNGGSFK